MVTSLAGSFAVTLCVRHFKEVAHTSLFSIIKTVI